MIFLALVSEFYSKGTLNFSDHCQDIVNNEEVLSTECSLHILKYMKPKYMKLKYM